MILARCNLLPSFWPAVTLPCIRRDQPDLKYILLPIPCRPPCTLDSFLPTSTPPLTPPLPLKGRVSRSRAAPESKTHVFYGNWTSLPISVATRLKKPPLRIHLLICIGFQRFWSHPRKTTLRKDLINIHSFVYHLHLKKQVQHESLFFASMQLHGM